MISCAICDDNVIMTETVQLLVNNYSVQHANPILSTCYTHAQQLIDDLERGKKFDIYFLDILMPDISGIDFAKKLRKTDENAIIIFLTSSDEYTKEAFLVDAIQYLQKPVSKEDVFKVLTRAIRFIGDDPCSNLIVKTKNGVHKINICDIIYVSSYKHVLSYHLRSGSIIDSTNSSITLKKLTTQLPFPPFIAPYRGYLVNMEYIDHLEKNMFITKQKESIPIPAKEFSSIKKAYSDYILSKQASAAASINTITN